MRRILIIIVLFISYSLKAQVLGYADLGLLFSNENNQGTARTMAMKNTYGALGGDLSAIATNPAGGAVYSQSAVSFTLGNNHNNTNASFYDDNMRSSFGNTSLSQVGGLLLFENDQLASKLRKVSFAINIQRINDFNNSWRTKGKSHVTWLNNPTDESIRYTELDSQLYNNYTSGNQTQANFSIAAQYGEALYVGASFNTYSVEYEEDATREEVAHDAFGNSIDAYESFWQEIKGDGLSISLGAIYKIKQNIRVGLSYTSPVKYELYEANNLYSEDLEGFYSYENEYYLQGYFDLLHSNENVHYVNSDEKFQEYTFDLRIPSKTTASFAYIFGRKGLVSADLTSRNYQKIRLLDSDEFKNENEYINDAYVNTLSANVGSEWRIKKLSLRAGLSYDQRPYKESIKTDNKRGFSLGAGYTFGKYVFDIAYDHSEYIDYVNFYNDFNDIDAANLSIINTKVLATLVIKL